MTAVKLLAGYAADLLLGDPEEGDPVKAFGTIAARVEEAAYAPDRNRGAVVTGALVTSAALAGRRAGMVKTVWATLGGSSLRHDAEAIAALLEQGDEQAARESLGHLWAGDATELGADQIRATVVSSLAENTADAAVGALFWAALLGPGGAAAYAAANTLDAMFDPGDERYAEFGWAAERLNSVLNRPVLWLTGALTVVSAPLVGGAPAQAARSWIGGGSPRVEAAFNGALGLDGSAASADDVRRAVRLSLAVGASAALTCALIRRAARRAS